MLPIIRGEPVLHHKIVLSGLALESIHVVVRRGLQVILADEQAGRLQYDIANLTVGGMTILVQWQPRE